MTRMVIFQETLVCVFLALPPPLFSGFSNYISSEILTPAISNGGL